MRVAILAGLLAVAALAGPAPARAGQAAGGGILKDPVMLNIGLVCQWDWDCMGRQREAMRKSLKYVAKYRPPKWRIHQCNRNARRTKARVDWVGFDRCIRNERLPQYSTLRRRA